MTKNSAYDNILKKLNNVNLAVGNVNYWTPPDGRSEIRILPPVGKMDAGEFFVIVGRHFQQKQYCPSMTLASGDACPICEVNQILYSSGDIEEAKKFRASRAFWINIIVRGQENKGPQVYTPGVTVFSNIVAIIKDPDYGDITDLESGFDIKIDRKGKGMETEYSVYPAREPTPLAVDKHGDADYETIAKWVEDAPDIKTEITGKLLPYDELVEKAGLTAFFDAMKAADDDTDDALPDAIKSEPAKEDESNMSAAERIRARLANK